MVMKKLSDRLNDLTQEAVDKAIEKHRLRGESIAISDDRGKVRVVPAQEIPPLLRGARGDRNTNNYEQ